MSVPVEIWATALAIVAAWWRLRFADGQAKKKAAADLMLRWATEKGEHWDAAVKLISTFDRLHEHRDGEPAQLVCGVPQCRRFWESDSVALGIHSLAYSPRERQQLAESILEKEIAGDTLQLSEADVAVIRGHVMSYLNMMEGILVHRFAGTADRDILDEQFKKLVRTAAFPINLTMVGLDSSEEGPWPSKEFDESFPQISKFLQGPMPGKEDTQPRKKPSADIKPQYPSEKAPPMPSDTSPQGGATP